MMQAITQTDGALWRQYSKLPEKSINSFKSLKLHKTRDKTFAPWTQPEMIWDELSCTGAGGEMIMTWYSQTKVVRYHFFTYTHTRILTILQPGLTYQFTKAQHTC